MNDPELFELCKQVYELTGLPAPSKLDIFDDGYRTPHYTSDYLLEKLQIYTSLDGNLKLWSAKTISGTPSKQVFANADTPLKALLKLVIALHEAGVEL